MGWIAKIMLRVEGGRRPSQTFLQELGKAELQCAMCNVHAGPAGGGGECMQGGGTGGMEWRRGSARRGRDGCTLTGSSRYLWTCQGLPTWCGWVALAWQQLSCAQPPLSRIEWSRRWQRVQIHQDRRGGGAGSANESLICGNWK